MVQGHLTTLGAGSWIEADGPDKHNQGFPGGAPQPATQPSQAHRAPAPPTWSTPLASGNPGFGVPESQTSFGYESASGATQALDRVVLALARHHISAKTETSGPTAQANNDTVNVPAMPLHSAVAASRPVDSLGQQSMVLSHSTPLAAPSAPSSSPVATPLHPKTRDSPRIRTSAMNVRSHQRRRVMSTTPVSAMQTSLLEDMVCSGTQCNVRASPLPSSIPAGRSAVCSPGSEPILEVDQVMTEDSEFEASSVKRYLETRRANRPMAVMKNGLVEYLSATDTAMRSRNLVRRVPRMRKRRNSRRKEAPSGTPSRGGPAPASTTMGS